MLSNKVRILKVSSTALVPTQATENSAGFDIYSNADVEILPHACYKVPTGIIIEFPAGYFGMLAARSGLSTKQGLRLANGIGVIDQDYRGEIIVPLFNDSNVARTVFKGDRIAQLILLPYSSWQFVEVDVLDETNRGAGGFGSTGK